jgi:putative lipase involved disintegration of autophagic bodies
MWAKIRSDVLEGLRQHVHTRRLIITGISLGGGLAAISYVDIQATGEFDNIEVITFGAPRVGNKKWAKWFDTLTQSTRIYIRRDPIAFLPRCLTPICNYRQTGNPIVCYPGKAECRCKNKSIEDELEMNEAVPFLLQELNEHKEELAEGEVGGILDHIYGYKKIKDYSLVC